MNIILVRSASNGGIVEIGSPNHCPSYVPPSYAASAPVSYQFSKAQVHLQE